MNWNKFTDVLPDKRDSAWQFYGAIAAFIAIPLGIIAIGVTIYLSWQTKAISYDIISNSAIVNVQETVGEEIEVLYNGTSVPNAHIVLIKIWNSGNVDIPSSEFEEPIKIQINDAEILSVEISDQQPENLIPDDWLININSNNTTVYLPALLFNQDDSYIVQMLLSDSPTEIKVSGRIIGVSDISFDNSVTILVSSEIFIGMVIAFLMSGLTGWLVGIVGNYRRARQAFQRRLERDKLLN